MIDHSIRDGVTTLQMQRDPANVLDTEFADAIEVALREAVRDDETRAIVLTGVGSVFSAGVDLFRLVEAGEAYIADFLASLGRLFHTAQTSHKPLVAAVNGHAIAGGGILALACDYRVMAAGSARIGLPELKVGVPFPSSALAIVKSRVPRRFHREIILLARTFEPEAALVRGLIDEIAPPDEVLARSTAIASELANVPVRSFSLTKRLLALPAGADTSVLDEEVHATWTDPETREHIRRFLEKTLGKRER
ncbi:MAG: enoyl-CoA hydratase/isomerase family protein [Gemmatimonadota bacterium]